MFMACDRRAPVEPAPFNPLLPVARIELTGLTTVAPGQSATFKATAFFTNGSSRDVTSEAQWRTQSAAIFQMDAPGQGTAGQRGDVAISVAFNGVMSTLQLVVVPDGTYRLSGIVRLSGATGGVVTGAVVAVLDAPERLETTTGPGGWYLLFGVPGTARIRVTRPGFITSEQTVQLTEHQSLDFALVPSAPLPDLTGTYTLRITMTTACGEKDPGPEFRDRTYTATITHSTPSFIEVTLSGAEMVVSSGKGDRFTGTVDFSEIRFFIDGDFYGYSYPQIVERLPNGMYFTVGGVASVQVVPEGLVGRMEGFMTFSAARPPQGFSSATCFSRDIRFALLK
jgi:hypothetical protein